MAIENSRNGELDPLKYGEVPKKRNTKGTPNAPGDGMSLELNYLPPGEMMADQHCAVDVKRIEKLMPTGPILK